MLQFQLHSYSELIKVTVILRVIEKQYDQVVFSWFWMYWTLG